MVLPSGTLSVSRHLFLHLLYVLRLEFYGTYANFMIGVQREYVIRYYIMAAYPDATTALDVNEI